MLALYSEEKFEGYIGGVGRVGKKVFWFFGLFGFLAKSKKPAIVWFFAFWLFAQKWVYCWL